MLIILETILIICLKMPLLCGAKTAKAVYIYIKESLELYTSDCVEFFIADGKVIASWSELSEKGLPFNKY